MRDDRSKQERKFMNLMNMLPSVRSKVSPRAPAERDGSAGMTVLRTLAAALALFAVPGAANAQICQHGIGGAMGVFDTNCLGVAQQQFAHPGDLIGIQITASYNDFCGETPFFQGDRS